MKKHNSFTARFKILGINYMQKKENRSFSQY